jgi:DNA-binding transcriptional LysR family regulator
LELAQIRYFVALCSERNFTRAAKRCGVSQPSLSNGIKALECELGGKLFERSDMSLTPLGKSLRLHFESAVASVGQITMRAMAFHRRQLVQRHVAAARSLRLLDPVVPLSGARYFDVASQGEAAHDGDSRENHGDQHIVAYQDRVV